MISIFDKLNSFVLEFKSELSEFDTHQFKEACSFLEEAEIGAINMISPSMYTDYITKSIESLQSVSSNIDMLYDFFSKIYKSAYIDDKNISIPLQNDNDIEKIRPEYLKNISADFEVTVKKILQNELDMSDIKKKYISGDYFSKMKKQLAKTTVTMNDVRDLLFMDSPTIVKVTGTYIQSSTLPFLRSFNQNMKELTVLSANVTGSISSTYAEINDTLSAVNAMVDTGKIDKTEKRTIDYCKVNIIRGYMNMCAYVSALLIRKISYLTYNIMAYTNLYNTIHNYFPEGDLVLHESVLDGDLNDIDDDTLLDSIVDDDLRIIIPHIQNAITKKKMEISNIIAKKQNIKLNFNQDLDVTKYPYDTYPYAYANKTIIDIIECLKTFESMLSTDLVVDDIIQKSGLSETFTSKYSNVLSVIPSIQYYTSQMNSEDENMYSVVTLSLYNDISHFETNVKIISDNIHKCYVYIESLIKSFEINDRNMDDNSFNELKSFTESLMKNYKDYILLLTKKLLDRLDNLTETLDDSNMEDWSEPESFVPYDYSFEAFSASLNDIYVEESKKFSSMLREYNALRLKKEKGVNIVYEDVAEADSEKTTVTVKTDASQQNENKKTETEGGASTQKTDGDKKSIIDTFKEWFRNIINKFSSKSDKMSKDNSAWIARVKGSIQSLNTDNTTITVAKYEEVTSEKITSDINNAITKINSINSSNLPNELKSGKSKAELYIFSSIPEKIGNETSLSGRIKQFLIHGKSGKSNLVSYSGEDAKSKINEMISFVENYGKMYKDITNNLQKLSDAAANKQTDIINSVGNKSVNESVLFEANQNEVKQNGVTVSTDKDSKEKINTSSVITSIVREYCGAVLTVVEKKYLDYVKVLNKLAPNESSKPEDITDNKDNKEE